MLSRHLAALLAGATSVLSVSYIAPGAVWYDTSGAKIDAHGGGVFKSGNTFYWTGHSAANETPMMYSSTDLMNWQNLGQLAPSITGLWRPKYAKPNGSNWIFGQYDRYSESLKSSSLTSGYSKVAQVHLPPNDYSYSDTGMFYDEGTQTYYLLTSADHNIVQVNKINSDGSLGDQVNSLSKGSYEAPGMFKAGGYYYLIVSGKTGWRSNPNKVFYASSISGSWSGGTDIAPQAENTYNSQNTFELTIQGSSTTTYIYMGDSWDSKGGASSNYVWLPMTVDTSAHTVTLNYHSTWKVDVNTGVVSAASTKKRYEAEDASISGTAVTKRCETCHTKRGVHGINSGSEVEFRNVTGTGALEYVTFHYSTVSDGPTGEAHIFVNGQEAPTNLSDLNSYAGHHSKVAVPLKLDEGDVNTIRFGVSGDKDFQVVLDGIELHE